MLSAFSLFIAFHILQPLALSLDLSFNLLSSKDVGKIAFMSMVIVQCVLFLATLPYDFLNNFFKNTITFFFERSWLKRFFEFFSVFFALHAVVLAMFYVSGVATLNPAWGVLKQSLIIKWLIGFIATFFLAWSEELIFRGMLYPYFAQFFSPLTSALVTSTIFSLAHDLRSPWTLASSQWQLGLGLFLLGLLLNLIFIVTKRLEANMGAHAGLVFLKVMLRKAPILMFAPPIVWWASADLRESFVVHVFFGLACVVIMMRYRNQMISSSS